MLMIVAAAAFDFADGLAARLLKVRSAIGKDLDSLADVVSFGAAPGMMLFDFIDRMQHAVSWPHSLLGKLCMLGAFAVPIFSALRLARFNNDARQDKFFIGLPVPAHALFWASLINAVSPSFAETGFCSALSLYRFSVYEMGDFLQYIPVFVAVSAIGMSLLLVSSIPMFSLKMTSLKWSENKIRYLFIGMAIACIVLAGVLGITLIIIIYILLSIFNRRNK